ncbi:MAG: hypothetical protein AAF557_16715 [Pseudomonadota bacterium]
MLRIGKGFLVSASVIAFGTMALADQPLPPKNTTVFQFKDPQEASGVAAVGAEYGSFAVVGDEDHFDGRLIPGRGKFPLPRASDDQDLPKKDEADDDVGAALGPEGIDVGFLPDGRSFWVVVGEDNRTVSTLDGQNFKLDETFKEVCGRGAEGLSLGWKDDAWLIAVLWEGGYYEPGKCKAGTSRPAVSAIPNVVIFKYNPEDLSLTQIKSFPLKLDSLEITDGQIFRAPDLAWRKDMTSLTVLLASSGKPGTGAGHLHTWLQVFDLDGDPDPSIPPFKLEDEWGDFEDPNWEGLDYTLDHSRMVMVNDNAGKKKKPQWAVIFKAPF